MERKPQTPALTENGRRLLRKLAELPPVWFTAAELAESVGISRRTVMRELPGMEKWMAAAGFRFVRSPGQGLRLDEDDSRRLALREQLEGVPPALSRQERGDRLLALLFAAAEPVKLFQLSHELAVSEHTLLSDLDALSDWLHARGVELKRRTGVGVWLEGSPENLRRALGTRLRPLLRQQDLQKSFDQKQNSSPVGLLAPDDLQTVVSVLQTFEQAHRFCFSDSAFLSLVIHLTLLAGQVRQGAVQADGGPSLSGGGAAELKRALEAALGLRLPGEESDYLAHCLAVASGRRDWTDPQEMDLRRLAAVLIEGMGRELGVDMAGFSTLRDDLCTHLRPMLLRMQRGERTDNPQLRPIQEQYPRLWQATRRVCDAAARQCGLPVIPDEEAAYLAMHFGAVLEECAKSRRRLRAVVVCPMGMATSRFLISQIDKEFPEIAVERMCALRELDTDALRREGIDLIISTVRLHTDFPHLTVGALLEGKDRTQLQNAVASLQHHEPPSATMAKPPENGLRYAGALSGCMIELVDTIRIQELDAPRTRADFIIAAAAMFCPDPRAAALVEAALHRRETLGDTFMQPLGALLLHCKTPAVAGCRLGYLRARHPFYEGGAAVRGALVMLAPDSPEPVYQQVMQEVSGLLIDQPALLEAFRGGAADRAAALLETGLDERFYQALGRR